MPWANGDRLTPANLNTKSSLSYFNVRDEDYGAIGNGTTDDVTAIQLALTSAKSAGGGVVFLPPGTYSLSTSLDIREGVSLHGSGLRVSTLSIGAGAAIRTKAVTTQSFTAVRDLDITGNSAAGTIAIDLTDISNSVVERVEIRNATTGVLFNSVNGVCYYNWLGNLWISGISSGFSFVGPLANENWAFGCKIDQATTGIDLSGVCTNNQFYAVDLENITTGMNVAANVTDTKLIGSRIDNATPGGTGVAIASGAARTMVIGCHFASLTTDVDDSGTSTVVFPTAKGALVVGGGDPGDVLSTLEVRGLSNAVQPRQLAVAGPSTQSTRAVWLGVDTSNGTAEGSLQAIDVGSGFRAMRINRDGGSVVVGGNALASTATTGFFYVPSYTSTAAPGGTPSSYSSAAACVFNAQTKSLHIYDTVAGSWSGVSLA